MTAVLLAARATAASAEPPPAVKPVVTPAQPSSSPAATVGDVSARPSNVVYGAMGFDYPALGYERVLGRRGSAALQATYVPRMAGVEWHDAEVTLRHAWALTARTTIYFLDRGAPCGPFVGGLVLYGQAALDEASAAGGAQTLRQHRLAVGAAVGWSWLLWRHLVVKVGGGGAFWHVSTTTHRFRGVMPLGDLGLGFAW